MNVYLLAPDADRFQALDVSDDHISQLSDGFHGEPMASGWEPLPVEVLVDEPADLALIPGDFPTLGVTPVFSGRAVEALRDLLDGRGELLPLLSSPGEYYAFNITRLSGALDERASKVERFDDGRIMHVNTYEFIPQRLDGETIFKLAQLPDAYEFVTDTFRDRVLERDLTGFLFQQVWPNAVD